MHKFKFYWNAMLLYSPLFIWILRALLYSFLLSRRVEFFKKIFQLVVWHLIVIKHRCVHSSLKSLSPKSSGCRGGTVSTTSNMINKNNLFTVASLFKKAIFTHTVTPHHKNRSVKWFLIAVTQLKGYICVGKGGGRWQMW